MSGDVSRIDPAAGDEDEDATRIALIVPSLAGGGIATVLLVIARGLAERGHGVDLVVFNRSGALAGRVPGNVRLVDLDTRKLVAALPKLVAYLRRARPGLVIAASWYAVLVALVRELGIGHAVELPGFVANPFAWMARARVFAVSSIYEGLSMVLVEAMACGTPVVSTDCPHGPREVLEGGKWGPLVPVGDPGALAAAILETLCDPPPPDGLVSRSRAFSVEACIGCHVALMAEPRAGRGARDG